MRAFHAGGIATAIHLAGGSISKALSVSEVKL